MVKRLPVNKVRSTITAPHEIDICRWALGVDLPERVTSSGGRFHYDDAWEFPDTQVASYTFPENKMTVWEGKSCNNFKYKDQFAPFIY